MIGIYARQSIDKKDSISVETQIEINLKDLGYPPLGTYKIYIDKGYSGSNTKRPDFEDLVRDIESGLIHKVSTYKLDRISRSLLDFLNLLKIFESHKIDFLSCNEKFDTTTPTGRFTLNMIMAVAQLERETIQMRVKDNYYARGEKGMYLGGRPPYGFRKVETQHNGIKTYKYEIIDELQELVKALFTEYAATDITFGELVKSINGRSIRTNRGKSWSSTMLARLLRSPAYVRANADVYLYLKNKGASINNDVAEFTGERGCYVYGSREGITTRKYTDLSKSFVTLSLHEGLIDADTWLRCQYKIDRNKVSKNNGKGRLTWLTGLMKCGYCRLAMTAVSGRMKRLYTTCGGRKRHDCDKWEKTIYIDDLEEIIEAKLLEKLKTLRVRGRSQKNVDNKKLDAMKAELVTAEEQIEKLVASLLDMSSVSAKYVDAKIAELDKRKAELQTQIDEIMRTEVKTDFTEHDLQEYIDNWADYSLKQKNAVAKSVISRFFVTDDEIDIEFKL